MSEEKIITINGVEVPEPYLNPLRIGEWYWLANTAADRPTPMFWNSGECDWEWLAKGLIHLTEENARVHIDAMRRANKGET